MKKDQFYITFFLQKNILSLLIFSVALLVQYQSVAQTPVSIPTGHKSTDIFDSTGGFVITYGMLDRRLDQLTL